MQKLMRMLLLAFIMAGSMFAQAKLPENLTTIAPGKTTGPNADKMFGDIDKTYQEVYEAWNKMGQVYIKSGSIVSTMDKKNIIINKVAEIRQNTQNSIEALEAFKLIKFIGSIANASQLTLKASANQMDKVKGSLDGLDKVVLHPTTQKALHLKNCIVVSEEEVYNVLQQLLTFKKSAVEKCGAVAGSADETEKARFEQNSAKISEMLNGYSNAFAAVNERESKVNEINDVVGKVNPVFDQTIKSLEDFMSKFSGSRKAVHEVNKVLDKRFKKTILRKKISISVRDVVTGGGALNKVKGLLKKAGVDIEKWAREALEPVTKQLAQNLPGIPNFDGVYAKAEELKNKMDFISNTSNSFLSYKKTVEDFNAQFQAATEKEITAAFAAATPDSSGALKQTAEFIFIENRWKKTHINIEHGGVQCSEAAPGWWSAMWVIEEVPGTEYSLIKNRWQNTYLHVENGKLECSEIQPGWHSAMWKIQRAPGTEYYYITNRWKNTGINVEHGNVDCSDFAPGWHSAMWVFNGVTEKS